MDASEKNYTLEAATAASQAPAIPPNDWCSVFNTPEFFGLHLGGRPGVFLSLRDQATGEVVGRAHFTEVGPGHFLSPFRGTYGGFEAAETDMRLLEGFIAQSEAHLAKLGAKVIEIATKPFAHAPALSACLFNALVRQGYAVPVQDLSYALAVDGRPMADRMQRNNQKKLRKCQREGFVVAKAESPEDRRLAYEAVAVNRSSRGYSISMTYEQVETMAALFPGQVHYFTVRQGEKVIAGAVCVAVSRHVLYVFYWGDIPGYEVFSPVVMLAEAIHDFAKAAGFTLLDVGRSTENSLPNTGLIRFKEKLGFEASLKLTFRKQL